VEVALKTGRVFCCPQSWSSKISANPGREQATEKVGKAGEQAEKGHKLYLNG